MHGYPKPLGIIGKHVIPVTAADARAASLGNRPAGQPRIPWNPYSKTLGIHVFLAAQAC